MNAELKGITICECRDCVMNFVRHNAPIEFKDEPITVLGETVNKGDYSDLHEFYNKPLKYCGSFIDDMTANKYYAFEIEYNLETNALFGEYWYDVIMVVGEKYICVTIGRQIVVSRYSVKDKRWK
jgi:hypothetical protein